MFNQISIIGRLTAAPELRKTQSQTSVTSFSIAVNNKRKDKEDTTYFLDVIAWQGTADVICKYFNKGDRIGIAGFLQSRTYEDKEGKKRKVTEIVATAVEFIESKKDTKKPVESQDDYQTIDNDDDLPF